MDGRGRGAGVAKVFMDGFSGASVSSGWGAGLGGSRVSGRGSAIVGEVGGGLILVLDGGDVEKKVIAGRLLMRSAGTAHHHSRRKINSSFTSPRSRLILYTKTPCIAQAAQDANSKKPVA